MWIIVVLAAFYGFFWRYIQVFDSSGLYPDGQVDSAGFGAFIEQNIDLPPGDILVLHWLEPGCFCSVYSGKTVDKLNRDTSSKQVSHLVITPPGKREELLQLLPILKDTPIQMLSESAYQRSKRWLPASPAVVVYNRRDKSLSYLGPHSSGVVCGKGKSYVELVLNNLHHGFDPMLYELEQSGCFCPW